MYRTIAAGIQRFARDESGPTATEYAVMLALIIVICLVSIGMLGGTVNGMYEDSGNQIATAVAGS